MADHDRALTAPDMLIYQGDSLPTFAAAIEDVMGNAVNLNGSPAAVDAFLQIRNKNGTVTEHVCTIVDGVAGLVTFDWTGEITAAMEPGRRGLSVRVVFDDGDELIAPSSDRARITVRPALSDPT